ncbi:MAG: twin-arginine translocation pathway signal protein [Comamonadaceae bacterium]|nr:MAG: twin-arginine translocation pathway signal protein [Comamonadaceae bacterium]
MHIAPSLLRRRHLLAAGLTAPLAAVAASPMPRASARPVTIAQLFDASAAEQDVAKDFLAGSRAAWQEINSQGGLRGRAVQHVAIETDGTAAGVRRACMAALEDPACIALSGTAGNPVALHAVASLSQDRAGIAHVAPWLQSGGVEVDERTFPIFAGRQEQIAHALKSLVAMGVREVGAVFTSGHEADLSQREVAASAAALRLGLSTYRADGDLARLGQRLGPASPALLLFLGGTPELVQFTHGLDRQARQRYVIALGEVNLQTVLQMGASKAIPIIATQPVPHVGASLPVVRRYRDAMARLFDEPPAALGLAGYIAARYTFEVLEAVDGPLTRASALAAFQRRAAMDVGGYRVSYDESRRSATFVTQSMLTADGRVVG